MMNAFSDSQQKERTNYHLTLGDLIEKLKQADDSLSITPTVVGISAYRGYYSDIALCTTHGQRAYSSSEDFDGDIKEYDNWYQVNTHEIDFSGTPKELAEKLEALVGKYFNGYKGGMNEITLDKPLWLAEDYGNSSQIAVIGITDNLELVTKEIE